ncbi:MAG: hypothetical protein Q9204_003801 [Flavoplaca sp. TL-2023a]
MDDSIRRCHKQCFRAFKDLCTLLTRETEHQKELSPEDVGDLFARFNVWAGNIGAGQRGQASLDFRLREATSIKEHIVGTLQYLLESLEDATSIVSGSRLPYDQLSSDSGSSTSSLSNSSIQDDLDLHLPVGQLPVEDCARTELQQLQHSIATFVSNLYKVSIILRQSPTPHDRNTKAFKIDTSFYEVFDKAHVKAKYPDAKEALTERLGLANSRRRKYFKYREQHRQKLSRQDATKNAPPAGISDRGGQNQVNQDMLPGEQKTAPSAVQPASEIQPSATVQSTRASTFHAHDISPINIHILEQRSDAGTNTSFGSVSSPRQERLTIPPIPESAQGGREFECPYCYTHCSLKSLDNYRRRREWKRHVLRDLQPYICTFGGCSKADTMFERRRDWFGHELQVHRVEWCCNTPSHQAYATREEFRMHLNRHDEQYDDDQLGLMVDMFKRPAMESAFMCPICKDNRYQSLGVDEFEEHLGRHLEVISTFALPSDGGIDGSSDSIATENAVHNSHSNTDTSSSNPSDDIVDDNDDHGDKAHVYPCQEDTERLDGVQEPQQRYIRDLLKFDEESQHASPTRYHKTQRYITVLTVILREAMHPGTISNPLDLVHSTCFELRDSWLRDVEGGAQAKRSDHDIVADILVKFAEQAKIIIKGQMLIPENDPRFHPLMRESLLGFTRNIRAGVPLLAKTEHSSKRTPPPLSESLRRLEERLSYPLPFESFDEYGQDPYQSNNAVQESYEDWSFMQSIGDPRQTEPRLNLALAVPQASESNSTGGDRSISGEDNSGTRNTLDTLYTRLVAEDQSELLAQTAADRSPGTAEWIFATPSYLNLRKGVYRFLLLEGLPGCGKTILCWSMIENLRRDSVVCAFYFFQRFTEESTMETAVKALIHQLIKQAHNVPTDLLDNIDDRACDLDALLGVLQSIISRFTELYFILDGLNNCSAGVIKKFSRVIQTSIQQGSGARMLATSRFDLNIEDAIRKEQVERPSSAELQWHNIFRIMLISREVVEGDIIKMIGSSKYAYHLGDIVHESKGIFMWASGRLQQLDQGIINDTTALGHAEVPPRIGDLWKAILHSIANDASGEHRLTIAEILRLLSVSLRELDANEVHDCLNYDTHSMTWGKYRSTDSLEVWRRFPALLQLTGQPGEKGSATGCTDNLGFIHPSLQEILQSDAIHRGPLGVFAIHSIKAEEEIANRCVSHLLRYKFPYSYTLKRGWNAYAGQYWHQHIKMRKFTASKELTTQCVKLLDHHTPSFTHWTYMTRRYGDIDDSIAGDFGTITTHPSPIYYSALLDLYECAVKLWTNGADMNARGGKHEYPIVAAVVAGAERIVELLASINRVNDNMALSINTAATKAVMLGRSQILKKLLESGADVSYETGAWDGTLAHQAVRNDDLDCLRILTEYSADLDARDGVGLTPLHLATSRGRVSCMEFLLSKGVNIEAKDNNSHSPLLTAAKNREGAALVLLLEKGAKVDVRIEVGKTALGYALASLDLPMVISLLEHGASPNRQTKFGQESKLSTPLHTMAKEVSSSSKQSSCRRAIIEALLNHGADPNIPDEDGNLAETLTSDHELREILRRRRVDIAGNQRFLRGTLLLPWRILWTMTAPKDPGHPYAQTSNIVFNFYDQPTSTASFGYEHYISLPPTYDTSPDKPWPLILFLHGAGESQRAKNESYASIRHGVPKIILCYDKYKSGMSTPSIDIPLAPRLRGRNPNKGKSGDADLSSTPVSAEVCRIVAEEFVTVTPSLNMGYGWNHSILTALLDHIVQSYRVDIDRIHVTGFSMGGYGTWDLALSTPNRFASLMPICGGGDAIRAKNIKHVPQWVHHGERDDIIPISASEKMVKALKEVGAADVRFSRYKEDAHDSWTRAYGDVEVWRWVLDQKRESGRKESAEDDGVVVPEEDLVRVI